MFYIKMLKLQQEGAALDDIEANVLQREANALVAPVADVEEDDSVEWSHPFWKRLTSIANHKCCCPLPALRDAHDVKPHRTCPPSRGCLFTRRAAILWWGIFLGFTLPSCWLLNNLIRSPLVDGLSRSHAQMVAYWMWLPFFSMLTLLGRSCQWFCKVLWTQKVRDNFQAIETDVAHRESVVRHAELAKSFGGGAPLVQELPSLRAKASPVSTAPGVIHGVVQPGGSATTYLEKSNLMLSGKKKNKHKKNAF